MRSQSIEYRHLWPVIGKGSSSNRVVHDETTSNGYPVINETRSRFERWVPRVYTAGNTTLGVKMYQKETAVDTRDVFMGMNPARKEKETEGDDRYGRAGGSGLGRSTNR